MDIVGIVVAMSSVHKGLKFSTQKLLKALCCSYTFDIKCLRKLMEAWQNRGMNIPLSTKEKYDLIGASP